jgi:hypothetical protein
MHLNVPVFGLKSWGRIGYGYFRFILGLWFRASYFNIYPTRRNYIILAFISRTLHVSGIYHSHHQECITASAVVCITYCNVTFI